MLSKCQLLSPSGVLMDLESSQKDKQMKRKSECFMLIIFYFGFIFAYFFSSLVSSFFVK